MLSQRLPWGQPSDAAMKFAHSALATQGWPVQIDLLEGLRDILVELGGIPMGSREGMHSPTRKLWHYNSHETSRGSPLFLVGLGPNSLWEL